VVPDGVRDIGQEQIFAYGMRAGLGRFLDAFKKHRRKATFFMCGRAIERVPSLARQVVEDGHEPACHGWRWRPHADYRDRESEREDILKCIRMTEDATGQRPTGFFCRGSQSVHTRSLLAELGFEYDSNAFDDDLPYWDLDHPQPMLIVPYALDANDMKFFHPNGFAVPSELVEYVKAALNTLIGEAKEGFPKMLNIGFHLRICGRPARFEAVKKILEHLDSLGDAVWVATRQDIARHWKTQFPPT
jgi:peptidoglycan/xylan/chitin deacetylase (PgdA/CDA1 family)